MSKSRPLPQWPAGRKTITINEIAELLFEFLFPRAPTAEEHNSDLQTAALEKIINEPGRIDDTFENHVRRHLARDAISVKEHEKEVRASVEGTVRQEKIRLMVPWLLSIAHSSHVRLFDWLSGNIPDMEPHGGSRVYESGFQKIIIVALDHIKEADASRRSEAKRAADAAQYQNSVR
jgi:hypothetical protein